MRLDASQYNTLSSLLLSAQGQEFVAILNREYMAVIKELLTAPSDRVPVLQGQAQVLDELIEAFTRAPELRKTSPNRV